MGILSENIFEVSDNAVDYHHSFGKKYKITGIWPTGNKSKIFKCIYSTILAKSIDKFHINYREEICELTDKQTMIDLIKFILELPETDIIGGRSHGATKKLNLSIFTKQINITSRVEGMKRSGECHTVKITINKDIDYNSKIVLYFAKR